MSFYGIDKREEFLLSMLPVGDAFDFPEVFRLAEQMFVPVLPRTSAQFLKQIVLLKKPSKILEIGTGIGYSGLLMLGSSNAHLYTMDISEKNLSTAKQNFEKYGYEKRVTTLLGDASEFLPLFTGDADLIFLDGPKGRYYEYYPYLKKLLNSGGALVCDNVLYSGRITGESETPHSKQTITDRLNKFFELIKNDRKMDTSIIPVGDGMSLSIKK